MWTMSFQTFNLDLEKAEEPEIKLPTSTGSWKKQESSRKNISFCFIDNVKAFDCVDHNKLWKILKEMGIPDHLTCLLRNLYAGQEATLRTGHGTTDWFQIGKGVCQGCILSPCLFNLHAEYIMRNTGLEASCSVHQTWTGNSFHVWYYTCFNAILPNHPTLSLSHKLHKTVLYICVSFAVLHTRLSLPSF